MNFCIVCYCKYVLDMKLLYLLLAFDVGIGCCASAIVYLDIPVDADLINRKLK